MFLWRWAFISLLFLLFSCGSLKAPAPIEKVSSFQKPTVTGTLQVPVEVDLSSIFKGLEKEIPKNFSGKQEQCEGVSFDYLFNRNQTTFSGLNNAVLTNIKGAYKINASYCVHCSSAFGKDPFCIVPRLKVSCGEDEPMRRIDIEFSTKLNLDKDYRLSSKTNLNALKTIDPCEFTFLKYDASRLIEKEITKALKSSLVEIDREIQKITFKEKMEKLWLTAQDPILIPQLGYLHLNPSQLSIGDLEFSGQKLNTSVVVKLNPFLNGKESDSPMRPLPSLGQQVNPDTGFVLPVDFALSYDSLNQIIQQNWKIFEIKKGKQTIQVDYIQLLGPSEEQLYIQANFSGSKKGVMYLKGTPQYDEQNHILRLIDIDYELETKNLLLKSASWLFESKMQETLESKLSFDLGQQLENFRMRIEKEMNHEIEISNNQKVLLSGKLKTFDLSYIHPADNALELGLKLIGTASLMVR